MSDLEPSAENHPRYRRESGPSTARRGRRATHRQRLARDRCRPVRRRARRGAGLPARAVAAAVARLGRRHGRGAGAPTAYVAQALLAAVAGLSGAGAVVRLAPAWTEPLVLWQALVGRPSSGKSPALAPVRALLATLQEELDGDATGREAPRPPGRRRRRNARRRAGRRAARRDPVARRAVRPPRLPRRRCRQGSVTLAGGLAGGSGRAARRAPGLAARTMPDERADLDPARPAHRDAGQGRPAQKR